MWTRLSYLAFSTALVCATGACQDMFEQDGTTVSYKKCVETGKAQGLQEYTYNSYCRNKNQKVAPIGATGTAIYYFLGGPIFSGEITNTSKDYVITSYTIIIDASDKKTRESKTFDGVWIEPSSKGYFSFGGDDLSFKPDAANNPAGSWQWNIQGTQGIKIKI
jgi:hypothetical protein